MQIRSLVIVVDTGGRQGRGGICVLVEGLDDSQDRPVLEERQLTRPEVIEQRPERLRTYCHLGVQPPTQRGIESRRARGVIAHGVGGHGQ